MGGAGRGWGGVLTMAAACALAVTAVLVPITPGGGDARAVAAGPPGPLAHARSALAQDDDCAASPSPASGTTDGAAVERIKARGRLLVGVDQNSYLWGYRDPSTGVLAGFDIDIVKAIARDILGDASKVQYLTVPTDQRIQAIKQRKVDLVVRTMTINCARAGQVAFSVPYFTAGQQILAPKDSPVTGFDDSLKGRTVCTADTSTGQATLEHDRHGAHVMTVPNQLDCLVRLQLGQADAVFTDNALAAGQAAQDPAVRLVGHPVTSEPYGVAVNLDDQDLVRRVNEVLARYESGGAGSEWMRSYDTWLAKDLPGITGPPPPVYR
ncbi:glutamate ABC transporter substrate-binding protein [Streptomyces sp. HPF1205]|uniref:glutamate ABC transporter substrate-binding protein n=1 Tax=Streptomyces sp. HPF1205 TaxID=2873262 RepID=UPI001CED5B1C|nr:glutamate ABC transporter substrate-binding protein [Streptomyces sp. HPF1205]